MIDNSPGELLPTPDAYLPIGTAPNNLLELEGLLAIQAKDMLNGWSRKAEQQAFRETLDEYEGQLQVYATDLAEELYHLRFSDKDVFMGVINGLLDSKERIVTDASFMHATESPFMKMKHKSRLSKRNRRIGQAILAGAGVGASVVVGESTEFVTAAASGIIGWSALKPLIAVAGGVGRNVSRIQLARKMRETSGRTIRKTAFNKLDDGELTIDEMLEIVDGVSHIEDSDEKSRAVHREITRRKHLDAVRGAMIVGLENMSLRTEVDLERFATEATRISTASLEAVYSRVLKPEKSKAQA